MAYLTINTICRWRIVKGHRTFQLWGRNSRKWNWL